MQAEQKNTISKDELYLIFNESFNDLKFFGINAGIGIAQNEIPAEIAIKFYDIYNELICKLNDKSLDIWLAMKKQGCWKFELTFDNKCLDKIDLKLPKEYGFEYSFEQHEDCTIFCFKGGEL